MGFKSDIEIAQECQMSPITEIAAKAGIDDKYLEQYGKYKAKIDYNLLKESDKKDGKLILETMVTFEDAPKKLWIKFPSITEYEKKVAVLNSILETSEGNDEVIIYCEAEKKMNKLPKNCNIKADDEILNHLKKAFGEDCIRLV